MSQFSRRARWLNILFPASVAPQVRDPHGLSEDVSLVQPYDAGGLDLLPTPTWFTQIQSTPAAASGQVVMRVTDPDQVFRILAISSLLIAGAGPVTVAVIGDFQSTPNRSLVVTDQEATLSLGASHFNLDPMVLGPSLELRGDHFSGDANTIIQWSCYGIPAPVGTVFPF